MKRVIRHNVWETNSSTSHSVVIMTAEQNDKWENEDLYYYPGRWDYTFNNLSDEQKPKSGRLYTQDEVLQFYKLIGYEYKPEKEDEDYTVDDYIYEMGDFIGYDRWSNDEYLEQDTNYFTTPSGEEIVVHCKYGYDG